MAITKVKKGQILNTLTDSIATQKAVVLLTTHQTKDSLNASDITALRKFCYDQNLNNQVVKNTLIQKAFPAVKELVGQTYVISNKNQDSDEVTTPKAIIDIILDNKEFADKIAVKGAIINGEFFDKAATIALSKVPSFNDSMGMIAGSISQVTTKIARIIKEIPSSVARGIKAAKA